MQKTESFGSLEIILKSLFFIESEREIGKCSTQKDYTYKETYACLSTEWSKNQIFTRVPYPTQI